MSEDSWRRGPVASALGRAYVYDGAATRAYDGGEDSG